MSSSPVCTSCGHAVPLPTSSFKVLGEEESEEESSVLIESQEGVALKGVEIPHSPSASFAAVGGEHRGWKKISRTESLPVIAPRSEEKVLIGAAIKRIEKFARSIFGKPTLGQHRNPAREAKREEQKKELERVLALGLVSGYLDRAFVEKMATSYRLPVVLPPFQATASTVAAVEKESKISDAAHERQDKRRKESRAEKDQDKRDHLQKEEVRRLREESNEKWFEALVRKLNTKTDFLEHLLLLGEKHARKNVRA